MQRRSKANLCDCSQGENCQVEPAEAGEDAGNDEVLVFLHILMFLPKHKAGGGEASGGLLLQGNCSVDDEDKPTIETLATAQVIPFRKPLGRVLSR